MLGRFQNPDLCRTVTTTRDESLVIDKPHARCRTLMSLDPPGWTKREVAVDSPAGHDSIPVYRCDSASGRRDRQHIQFVTALRHLQKLLTGLCIQEKEPLLAAAADGSQCLASAKDSNGHVFVVAICFRFARRKI
jgi:hypothetical protein